MIFKLFVLIISFIASGFSRPEYLFKNAFVQIDGVPAAENPDEVIKASHRVHEKLDEVDLSKTTVVNLFGSTALTLAGQLEQTPRVLSSIKHRMKALGRSSEEIELAQQQAKELMQNPDVAEVIETHEATLQEVEQEVQKLEENLERLEQKHEELAASDVLKAGSAGAESIQTPLETLQAQLEHMDLSTPEGQSLQYHIAAIDHDQKVNTLSHKLLLKTAETVEKFESFLEKNPNLAKTMRYGVDGINGVLMATGVKGLLTGGLPKALVALGFGEALSTASSWAGGKVEGMVAEVATSESEARRFMKALKTCAETAGVVVGVKIATKTAKSLKASKIQSPVIKDALSERPIIKDGKVWLGDKELGAVNRNAMIARNRRLGKEFEAHIGKLFDGVQIETQVPFKNGIRQKAFTKDCSVVDFLVHMEDEMIAIEAKRPIVPTTRNLYRMADRTGEQILKADRNLPKGVKQRVWIDNRTQGIGRELQRDIGNKISIKSGGCVTERNVRFIGGNDE